MRTGNFLGAVALAALTLAGAPAWAQDVVTFQSGAMPRPPVGNPELVKVTPDLVAAAKKEGELDLMYSGQQGTTEGIASEFGKQYGIKIVFNRQVGAAGTQAFATQERAGRHATDVQVSTDGAGFLQLVKEGLYANFKVDSDRPDIARIDGWGYAPFYQNVVNSYNPKLITLDQAKAMLTDWNKVLDPSLKGKIGLLKPTSATQSFLMFWMWAVDPRYGEKFLNALAAQEPVFYEGSGPAREALESGDISVLLGDNGADATEAFLKGADINWQWPNTASHWASSFNAISAHAPHPNVARLYVAWLLGPDGAKATLAHSENPTYTPAANDPIADTPALKKTDWWPGPFPQASIWNFDKYTFFNPDFVNEVVAKVDEIFGITG